MWKMAIVIGIAVAFSGAEARSGEILPFHVSHLSQDSTVNLTVRSLNASLVKDYDFDVSVGIMTVDRAGEVIYTDKGRHAVRIGCDQPGRIFVGGVVSVPSGGPPGTDWKDDLWNSVCRSPVS